MSFGFLTAQLQFHSLEKLVWIGCVTKLHLYVGFARARLAPSCVKNREISEEKSIRFWCACVVCSFEFAEVFLERSVLLPFCREIVCFLGQLVGFLSQIYGENALKIARLVKPGVMRQ